MRSPRLLLAAIVVGLTAASGAVGSVHAAPSAYCMSRPTPDGAGWEVIRPPFHDGPQQVSDVITTSYLPDRMVATNGTDLVLTDDAGCHWIGVIVPKPGAVLGLPAPVGQVLPVPTSTHITAIAAPSAANITAAVYVGLQDTTLLTRGVRIGHYDGNQWRFDARGLPAAGRVAQIAASPTTPTIAYALIDPPSGLSRGAGLYVTTDGGSSWSLRNPDARSTDLRSMKVDPIVPDLLYALGPHGVVISHDGGRSFGAAVRPGSDIGAYDVTAAAGDVRIVQGHSTSPAYDLGAHFGTRWRQAPSMTPVRAIAIQPVLANTVVAGARSLLVLSPARLRSAGTTRCRVVASVVRCRAGSRRFTYGRVATPRGGPPTDDLQVTAPLGRGYGIVGVRDGAILRGTFTIAGGALVGPDGLPVRLTPGRPPRQFPSTLLAAAQRLSLAAGRSRDVSYRLLMPRTPSPIDVMFLVDTTSSTEHTIDGLRRDLGQIVGDLGSAGLDVEFGLADFRDYPPTAAVPGDGDLGDYPYRLDKTIGPTDHALGVALAKLRADGGGDPPEADLTALYQSTTGVGQTYRGHVLVRPGLQAGYRPDALKLAVLATDAAFHHERSYLTPGWETTVRALLAQHVHPIGLAVQKVDDQTLKPQGFPALHNESRLATDTGTVAPRGGVDCNGDLTVDVPAGAPFVCTVPVQRRAGVGLGGVHVQPRTESVRLAPAITTAAESLTDIRPVGLTLRGVPGAVARVVHPTPAPRLDLRIDNTVGFTVRYTCPRTHLSHRYRVGVDAGSPGRVVATSTMTLTCGAVPRHLVPPHLPAAAAAVAAVAPAAAPPAAPAAPANPPPNANPNPNPALNANVGVVGQQEEQRQLAYAGADEAVQEDSGSELAMSRLAVGAAVVLTAAAGYAARSRVAAARHRS